MKKSYIVLLCNKRCFLLLLLNKDTLKSREYTQIPPNAKVNAMGRNVVQSNAKLIVTHVRNLFSFKLAVSVQDAGMAGCMLHCSLD